VQRLIGIKVTGINLTSRKIWQHAQALLSGARPGDFNQAMMELGATICTPRAPACLTCPVVDICATRGELAAGSRRAAQKKREIHYALICRDGAVLLVQRDKGASLMAGMWELPETKRNGAKNPLFTLRHSITVTDYTVRVWRTRAPGGPSGEWIAAEKLTKLPLTGLTRKILCRTGLLAESKLPGLPAMV